MKMSQPQGSEAKLICEVPGTKKKINFGPELINLDAGRLKKTFPNSPLNLRLEFPPTNNPEEEKKFAEINALTKKYITEFLGDHPLRECFTYDGEKILPKPKKSQLL